MSKKEKPRKFKRVKKEAHIGGWSRHFQMGEVFEEMDKDIMGRNLAKYEPDVLLLKAPDYKYPLYCDSACFKEITDE